MKSQISFFLFTTFLFSQSFDSYFHLLDEGRIEEVKDQLPELQSKYPYDPTIKYLEILVNDDGDSTVLQFKRYVVQYANSDYADDAEMKVGEYLYSRGLYGQSSQQLKKIPLKYPKSSHIQRAVDLMVLSFEATGEGDSIRYYLQKFKSMYPRLKTSQYNVDLHLIELKKPPSNSDKKIKAQITDKRSHPWVVQLGAFGKYDNAKRLKTIVSGSGYPIDIVEVMSNGKRLHAVRIVRFSNEQEAEKVGREIKSTYGVNFRVLKRP